MDQFSLSRVRRLNVYQLFGLFYQTQTKITMRNLRVVLEGLVECAYMATQRLSHPLPHSLWVQGTAKSAWALTIMPHLKIMTPI